MDVHFGYVGTDAIQAMSNEELHKYVSCMESIVFKQEQIIRKLGNKITLLEGCLHDLMIANEYSNDINDYEKGLNNIIKHSQGFSEDMWAKYCKEEDEDECTTQ